MERENATASRGLPGELGLALAADQLRLPVLHAVEVIGGHSAIGQHVDPFHDLAFRQASASFVTSDRDQGAAEFDRQLRLRPFPSFAPFPKPHSFRPHNKRLPLWLSRKGRLWQYANMDIGRSGYPLGVANDQQPSNRVRELREAKGLSQKQLAELAHVTPSALNKLEMGKRGLDQQWMRRLARLLDCQPADLLPDEDNSWRLTDAERELLERYRQASERDRKTFGKVAEAILPYISRDAAA